MLPALYLRTGIFRKRELAPATLATGVPWGPPRPDSKVLRHQTPWPQGASCREDTSEKVSRHSVTTFPVCRGRYTRNARMNGWREA